MVLFSMENNMFGGACKYMRFGRRDAYNMSVYVCVCVCVWTAVISVGNGKWEMADVNQQMLAVGFSFRGVVARRQKYLPLFGSVHKF